MKVVFKIQHVTGVFQSDIREMTEYDAINLVNAASRGDKPLDFISWENYCVASDDWEKVYTRFSVDVLKNSVISFRIVR